MQRTRSTAPATGRARHALALFAVLVLWLAPAARAQSTEPDPAAAGVPMWVVRDDDSTIYITGTVHLLRDDQTWRSTKLDAAFAEAGELWLEVAEIADEGSLGAALGPLMQKYGAHDGPALSAMLTADEHARLVEALAEAGVSPEAIARMDRQQPWVTTQALGRNYLTGGVYKSENGIDYGLARMAQARGMPVRGMETLETQILLMVGDTIEDQLAELRAVLFAPPGQHRQGLRLADIAFGSWVRGETYSAEALMIFTQLAASARGLSYDPVFKDRNEAWAGVIEEMLKGEGVVFIAVGAGHLVGPDSLQERLKLRGIRATRH